MFGHTHARPGGQLTHYSIQFGYQDSVGHRSLKEHWDTPGGEEWCGGYTMSGLQRGAGGHIGGPVSGTGLEASTASSGSQYEREDQPPDHAWHGTGRRTLPKWNPTGPTPPRPAVS